MRAGTQPALLFFCNAFSVTPPEAQAHLRGNLILRSADLFHSQNQPLSDFKQATFAFKDDVKCLNRTCKMKNELEIKPH